VNCRCKLKPNAGEVQEAARLIRRRSPLCHGGNELTERRRSRCEVFDACDRMPRFRHDDAARRGNRGACGSVVDGDDIGAADSVNRS